MNEPSMLTEFQQLSLTIAMREMFNGSHFDVTIVRSAAEVVGRLNSLGGQDFEALRLMHCIKWAVMGPVMSRMVREKTLDLLGLSVPLEVVIAEPMQPEKEKSLWKLLRLK